MKQHMLTHTGEKPFKCDSCQTKFRQIGSLKQHMLTSVSYHMVEPLWVKFTLIKLMNSDAMNIH